MRSLVLQAQMMLGITLEQVIVDGMRYAEERILTYDEISNAVKRYLEKGIAPKEVEDFCLSVLSHRAVPLPKKERKLLK